MEMAWWRKMKGGRAESSEIGGRNGSEQVAAFLNRPDLQTVTPKQKAKRFGAVEIRKDVPSSPATKQIGQIKRRIYEAKHPPK